MTQRQTPTQTHSTADGYPDVTPVVTWTKRLESTSGLDRAGRWLQPVVDRLLADPARRDLLHGTWLGHAVHPVLTDLPIGFWTSASVLDVLGGRSSRPAAERLLALGLLTAVPAAVTGAAEWGATGRREKRVGTVHATANVVALGMYAASLLARRGDRHRSGVLLALAGGAATAVGGFLGGHLVSARKVSSRHPAFDDGTPGARPTHGG